MSHQPTVLIVDDEPRALTLLRNLIEPEGCRVISAADGATTITLANSDHPDVILLDVMMPGMDGYETCRRLRATPELATIPIILLTALDDRDSRLRGLDAGADDFISKPFDAVELRIRVRTIVRLNRYRRLYEETSRYEAAITHSEEGIVLASFDGTILNRNAAFTRLLLPEHQQLGNLYDYFTAADAKRLRPDAGPSASLRPTEMQLLHGKAYPTIVEITAGIVPWGDQRIAQFHIRDLTEKKNLETQLLRSQRIELLGQLSGSVVHDMNNILTAIGGSASLMELDSTGQNHARHLENIQKAIQRGAGMLRQLLSFARGSDSPLETLASAETVQEATELAKESFGALFEVSYIGTPDLPPIQADPTQLHQIVMNLAVNSRDAMPDGGKIEVLTGHRTVSPDEATTLGPGVRPGNYVTVCVRDYGTGIPPEIRSRLFDPFFTTKPKGKGTGLGLATVLRIVQRHDGYVQLDSEVGRGTAITCGFPVA